MSVVASNSVGPPMRPNDPGPLGTGVELPLITLQRLHQFRRRRSTLLVSRGLACVAIAAVGALLLAIFLDALWLNELARWCGSCLFYAVTLFVFYWMCVQPLRNNHDLLSIARQFERQDPRLDEKLLSAVELARQPHHGDSPAFRQQVQLQVAQALAPVDVRLLLPWQSVRPIVIAGGMTLLALCAMSLIPGLHLGTRVARALFPAADLGRIGRVAIFVEQPLPHSRLVPLQDMLAIVARVDGPSPDDVTLQIRTADQRSQQPMLRQGNDRPSLQESSLTSRFETVLSITEPWVEYRVTAQGAHTPWYRLTSQPRPQATKFYKTITPPAYAPQSPQQLTEEHGDLTVLQGSRVRLELETNLPTQEAQLRWSVPVEAAADPSPAVVTELVAQPANQRQAAEFTVESSGEYRVQLVASESGFTNAFSPTYTVTAIADQPPRLTWIEPQRTSLIASAEQMLSLAMRVEDEFPLAELIQRVRQGSQHWEESALMIPDDPRQVAAWDLDLLPRKLTAGDAIEIQVVARDRSGQVAESSRLQVLISERALQLAETEAEGARQQVAGGLEDLAGRVLAQQQALNELLAAAEADAADPASDVDRLVRAGQAAEQLSQQIRSETPGLMEQIERALAVAGDRVSETELRNAGAVLSNLAAEQSRRLAQQAQQLQQVTVTGTPEGRRRLQRELAKQAEQLRATLGDLASDVRTMVSHDVVSRRAKQLSELATAQRELQSAAGDASQSPERLLRQQMILARQMSDLQQVMGQSGDAVRQDTGARLGNVADELSRQIEQAERAVEDQAGSDKLQQLAGQIADNLDGLSLISRLDGGLTGAVRNAQLRTAHRGGSADVPLRGLAQVWDSDKVREQQASETTEQLAALRRLHRTGDGADRPYAAELGQARRATEATLQQPSLNRAAQAAQLATLAEAVETLTAGHTVYEASQLLHELLRQESWASASLAARTDHPRAWESYSQRLEQAVGAARKARLPTALIQRLEQLRGNESARRANQKISERTWRREPAVSAASDLQPLSLELRAIAQELAEHQAAARRQLDELAPELSELAHRAAEATQQVEEQTRQLAAEVAQERVPDPAARLAGLNAQMQSLEQPVGTLREALVDVADAQELLSAAQVQLARQADAAIKLVDRVEEQTSHSLDEATAAVTNPSPAAHRSQALEGAADQQADAATALEQLAQHFENLQNLPAEQLASAELPTPHRPSAAAADDASATAADSDPAAYARAEQLAELAAASPEEMLRRLEEQLRGDHLMQQEMSEIARGATEQALRSLEQAATVQQAVQPSLEASDPVMEAQKQLLAQDLRSVRDQTQQLLSSLIPEAKSTARGAQLTELEQPLEQLEQALKSSLQAVEESGNNPTFSQLQAAATQRQQSLRQAEDRLAASQPALSKAADQEIHQNDADLNTRRRELRERYRRLQQQETRAAQQIERAWQQASNRADGEVRRAQQTLKVDEQRLEQIRKQAQSQPDNASLQEQLAQMDTRRTLSAARQTAQEQLRDALRQRVAAAKSASEALNQQQPPAFEALNPSAELSEALAARAATRSGELAQALESWVADPPAMTAASGAQLQNALQQERDVGQAVQAAANDLARAARHEQRLQQAATAQQLGELAAATQQVRDSSVEAAQQQLSAAADDARSAGSPAGQASAEATAQATSAVAGAATDIQQSAAAVRELLSPTATSQQTAASPPSPPATSSAPSSSAALTAQQQAQMLDELDRQLSGADSLGAQDNNQPGQNNASSPAVPSTLAEAARQLATSLSRERQPPAAMPSADAGMATESSLADVNPQPAVPVRILDVQRLNGEWGELRQQSADDVVETRRDRLLPQVRQQVDAYFRSVAERSQAKSNQ